MKFFRNGKENKNINFLAIKQELADINSKLTSQQEKREKWENNQEKFLYETIEAKSKLENDKNKLLEEKIHLKDALSIKEKLIEEQEKTISDLKQTIKDLTDEINSLVKYKNENESLKKDIKKLEKENTDLKEKGIVVPKKVTGSTMPKKKQAVKETVRPVKG